MQQSRFLESNTKFSFKNHRATQKFGEDIFSQWSNNNFYRTSYNDMGVKVSVKRDQPGRLLNCEALIRCFMINL